MIEYLEIKIERVIWAEGIHELRTTISVNGQKYSCSQMLRDTELKSYFEQIWEYAGQEVLAQIKKDIPPVEYVVPKTTNGNA